MSSSQFLNFNKKPFSREVLKKLHLIIQNLINDPDSYHFRIPVDWVALKIPDYPKIIKNPMDLGTVKTKFLEMKYKTVQEVLNDIQLVWDNCLKYNPQGIWIYQTAQKLQNKFQKLVRNYFPPSDPQEQMISHSHLFPFNHRRIQQESSTKQSQVVVKPKKQIQKPPEEINPAIYQNINFQQKLKNLTPENLKMIINDIRQVCPAALFQYMNGYSEIHCEKFSNKSFQNIMQKINNLIEAQQHIQDFLMKKRYR